MTEILIAALPALFALAGTVATALLVNRRSTALILYRLDRAEEKLDALFRQTEALRESERAIRAGRQERPFCPQNRKRRAPSAKGCVQ